MKIGDYDLPDELYYHREHTWARIEDDIVRVGMDDFYQKTAGDTVYVDLPFEGDEVEQEETCGKVQSSKWVGKLIAPVSGEIVEVNEELDTDATLINQDPYGEGWILTIEPSNLEEDLENLLHDPEEIKEWIAEEMKKAEEEQAKE
jgi:glycine cleavage system H protein